MYSGNFGLPLNSHGATLHFLTALKKLLRVHTTESLKSKVFITFIAMIVRNEMFQKMEELRKKNRKAYTVPGILSELENIECTRNSVGKYRRKYALTSKQKQILKQFGMDEKYIDAGISKFSY